MIASPLALTIGPSGSILRPSTSSSERFSQCKILTMFSRGYNQVDQA